MYVELFGTQVNWLAQLFDLIGFAFILFAYQQKKLKFLFICIIAYAFFVAEAVVLIIGGENTWAGMFVSTVSIIRNILMIWFLKKKDKEMPAWCAIVLLLATWGASIPFFDQWYTYFPCIFLSIYTFSAIQKNYYILKAGAMILEGSYVVYNFVTGAYFGAIREIILVVSIIVSVIVLVVKEKKAKQQNSTVSTTNNTDSAEQPDTTIEITNN